MLGSQNVGAPVVGSGVGAVGALVVGVAVGTVGASVAGGAVGIDDGASVHAPQVRAHPIRRFTSSNAVYP